MHILLIVLIFALTLGLIFVRPSGLNEAWATIAGAGLMLEFRLVTFRQAVQTVSEGANVLLFLLGLLVLSDLLRVSGFFEWAAIHAARVARDDGRVLFRNVFLLGALTTAFLSLDTTAVILTPIVLSFVQRLKLSTLPFVLTCAFVANSGSLLLPVSNLTNLLFVHTFRWSFSYYVVRMALPQLAGLLVNYWLFRRLFKSEISVKFQPEILPKAIELVPDIPYFRGSLLVLGSVLVGYFAGSLVHVPPYVVALTGCLALFAWGKCRKRVSIAIFRNISWPIFPFVIGLFVIVRGVENIGLSNFTRRALDIGGHSTLLQVLSSTFAAGIGSNILNNIPMALLSISSLSGGASYYSKFGALLGCNLGPNLTIAGSLATMLVISSARRHGEDVGPRDFSAAGMIVTPIVLLAASLALYLSLRLFG